MAEGETYDLIVAGGGPAGSVAALTAARAGLRTLVLDRAHFPRPKVCGDCLNPSVWPVLERLGLEAGVRALPHSELRRVRLTDLRGRSVDLALPEPPYGEIAVRRSLLDHHLLQCAEAAGAEVRTGEAVLRVAGGWQVTTERQQYRARFLIAADGRNSTVCRALGLLPDAARNRLGLQTHLPRPPDLRETVTLELRPEGYCGRADVGDALMDLCLVSSAAEIKALRQWAERRFDIPADHAWQTIAPLARAAIRPKRQNLLLAGDTARVVEPFTGEGIYYALATGELAGTFAAHAHRDGRAIDLAAYWRAHRRLYRGRLWVNGLTRWAVSNPGSGDRFLRTARRFPGALAWLSGRVIRSA